MENRLRDMNLQGKSIDTDKSVRLQKRPTATNSLENFGSSFTKPYAGTRRDAKKTKNTFTKTENRGKATSVRSFQDIGDSDDELLLSSQPSTAAVVDDDLRRSPTKAHKQKSRENISEQCSHSQYQGSQIRKPHTSDIVKTMKFKKIKTTGKNNMESNTQMQEQSRSFSSKPSLSQKPPDKVDVSRNCYSNACSVDLCDDDSVASDSPGSQCVRSQPPIKDTTPRPKPRPQSRRELALEEIPVNSQVKSLSQRPGKVKATDCSDSTMGCRRKPIPDANLTRRSTLTPVHPVVKTRPVSREVKTKADMDPHIRSVKKPRIPKPTFQIPDSESSTEASRPHRGVKTKVDPDHSIPSIKKPRIPKSTFRIPDSESSTEAPRSPLTKPQDFPLLPALYSQKRDGASRCSPAPNCKSKQKELSPKPFPLLLSEEQVKSSTVTDCRSNLKKQRTEPFPLSLPKEDRSKSPADDCRSNLKKPPEPFPLSLPKDNRNNSPVNDCRPKQKRPLPSLSKEKLNAPSNDISDDDRNFNSEKPRPRPKRPKSDKGVRKIVRNREQASKKDGKKATLPALQPFPMNAQMLKGAEADGMPSPSAFRNRTLSGSSPKHQRRKSGLLVVASSYEGPRDSGGDWDEDFSMALSVDPKLLCPFCDALLPQPVTPFLKKLINNALKKSRHDPRPGNPLGRKAPSAIFITVCQRHTFEREELPKAEANSWPKSIDWEQLGDRIRAMRDDLEDLLSGLRAGTSTSLLWEDVKRELQAKGSRAVASVREQFANFEKAQAGYYGELGYAIIHQSLLDLFPPTSCDVDFANPLTPEQFVQLVLVPEVALRLIQEDMDLRGPTHIAKALQVLRDSSKYGVAMFPDDSNDNSMNLADSDQLGVADMIVMERARKRRQELEEEFQKEQEEQEFQRSEERKKDKERAKRAKNKTDDKRAGKRSKPTKEETEHKDEEEILRPKPRPLRKKRSASRLSQASTPEQSGYEGSEECFSTTPHSSQNLFSPSKLYESSDNNFLMEPEDEILVPDSDEGEESGTFFSARRGLESIPSQATIATEPASEHDANMTSSSESSPTTSNRRKKQRDWEDEESTPKPAKFPRTGVPAIKENSHPLLLARRRTRQPSGTEFAPLADVVNTSGVASDDNGIWVKSMMTPVGAAGNTATVRRQWSTDFAWLLSDGSQERA